MKRLIALSFLVVSMSGLSGCYFNHKDIDCEMCGLGRLDITCYKWGSPPSVDESTIVESPVNDQSQSQK